MKKLHPLAFAALTLPLILAACGTAATPTASTPTTGTGKLVKLYVNASAGGLARTVKSASSVKALGLPTDPTNAIPALYFDVHVRDSSGKLVAFNNGTYDPSGTGSTTLVLNSQNAFGQTLLLPEGQYTFENAVKDDAGDETLLAYGPANENGFSVNGERDMVMLKFHAVYDPANSTLDFSTNTAHLFTDTSFNLNLFAKSGSVNGTSYRVPTSDLGVVTYTLGSATDGTLNGAGSKLGVNLTALGTPNDSTLDVTASFNAWIRDSGSDTATFQQTTLSFSKAIESNAMGADTVMPAMSFATVAPATVGQAVTLSGTATDDQMVGSIKLYDNLTLVASTDLDDGVAAVTSDESGTWSTDWTPTKAGSHDLTVVVADSSGNETHSTQTVTAVASTGSALHPYDYKDFTLAPGASMWVELDSTNYPDFEYANALHLDFYGAYGSVTIDASETQGGPIVAPQYDGGSYRHYDPKRIYWVKYTNISSSSQNFSVDYSFHDGV